MEIPTESQGKREESYLWGIKNKGGGAEGPASCAGVANSNALKSWDEKRSRKKQESQETRQTDRAKIKNNSPKGETVSCGLAKKLRLGGKRKT